MGKYFSKEPPLVNLGFRPSRNFLNGFIYPSTSILVSPALNRDPKSYFPGQI
jgi:hypothetical protein